MTDPYDSAPLIPRDRAAHPVAYDRDYKTSIVRSPTLPLLSLDSTATEETGPTFGHSLIGPLDNNLILNWTKGAAPAVGERILVHGRVLDETGRPVPETLVEVWQANAGGRYRHVKDLPPPAAASALQQSLQGHFERGNLIKNTNTSPRVERGAFPFTNPFPLPFLLLLLLFPVFRSSSPAFPLPSSLFFLISFLFLFPRLPLPLTSFSFPPLSPTSLPSSSFLPISHLLLQLRVLSFSSHISYIFFHLHLPSFPPLFTLLLPSPLPPPFLLHPCPTLLSFPPHPSLRSQPESGEKHLYSSEKKKKRSGTR